MRYMYRTILAHDEGICHHAGEFPHAELRCRHYPPRQFRSFNDITSTLPRVLPTRQLTNDPGASSLDTAASIRYSIHRTMCGTRLDVDSSRSIATWRTAMQAVIRGWLIALLSVVWLSGVGLAASGEPTEFIRHTTDSILQVFEDPHLQGSARREERLTRLQHIANTAFDWQEISQRALATHWRERTPQERQEFAELFREAVQGMYLERLEAAAQRQLQEKPAILYRGEEVNGQRAVVRTTVVTRRRLEIPLEYRLRQSDGQWRIYDVVIVGVSLVNNYRAQFHRIITQSSYQGLIQQLKAKQLGEAFAEPPRTPQ